MEPASEANVTTPISAIPIVKREQIRMRVLADAQMLPEEDSSDAHHAENSRRA